MISKINNITMEITGTFPQILKVTTLTQLGSETVAHKS